MFAIRISILLILSHFCTLSVFALTPRHVQCRRDQYRHTLVLRDCFEAVRKIPHPTSYSSRSPTVWPPTFKSGDCGIWIMPVDRLRDGRLHSFTGSDPVDTGIVWESLAPLVVMAVKTCFADSWGYNLGSIIMDGMRQGTSPKYLVLVGGTSVDMRREADLGRNRHGQTDFRPADRGRVQVGQGQAALG